LSPRRLFAQSTNNPDATEARLVTLTGGSMRLRDLDASGDGSSTGGQFSMGRGDAVIGVREVDGAALPPGHESTPDL
jgi:hypothetical protein